MKKTALFALMLLLPAFTLAQYNSERPNVLVMKQIKNGKVCDSCVVTMAGRLGANSGQISFLTPNYDNQFLYTDASLMANYQYDPNSKFFVSMGQFSLDFYPYANLDLLPESPKNRKLDFKDLQYKTLVNLTLKTDWKDITSLKADPDFFFGHTELGRVSNPEKEAEITPVEHYHADKFDLRLHDSLTVLVRNKHTLKDVYRFTITRVRSVPDYFEFIQFSSTKSFEEILNTEVNKQRMGQGPQSNYLEMEAGNSAFLRFTNAEQYAFFGTNPRNNGIEYAFGDRPDDWKSLTSGLSKFTNGFTYIYLHNPASGRLIKVLLRYKHQPESIYEVTIRVKEVPGVAGWIRLLSLLLATATIFGIGFFIQKKVYNRRLAKIDRKKNEIENQLQLLTGQLNPHFLFNSLNAVQGLIRQNDNEAANQYITEVATFMRTIMDSGQKELVSLLEDIQIEERYIVLEQKRRPFRYVFENNCNQNLAGIDFPPLLLQPIIENSIRHGFATHIQDPVLTISIRCNDRDLIITVSDNGIGYDTAVNAAGHGLSLIRKRIDLINQKLSPMQITIETQSAKTGTSTQIILSKWLS
jgi:hypothetical protein